MTNTSIDETELPKSISPGELLLRGLFGIGVTAVLVWIMLYAADALERPAYQHALTRLGDPASYDISHEYEVVWYWLVRNVVTCLVYLTAPWLGYRLLRRQRAWAISYAVILYVALPVYWFILTMAMRL